MSNEVPDMSASDDVKPYCIWYPEVASEDTYRRLVKTYPDMVYTVGRACAVAGYDKLYQELNILPEVSIAEEARDNASAKAGSKAIFDHIMSQPVCYAVLDDYTRTANPNNPRCPAFMNGDTAVRSLLEVRVGVDKFKGWSLGKEHNFDIVEDNYIAETSSRMSHEAFQALAKEHEDMLYTPLHPHLPAITKDPLILMAAYEGNLDRYVRLRRPKMLHREAQAVIRGIYHNTTFAKYWSLQNFSRDELISHGREIKRATIARFIMVNDLSHITPSNPHPNGMPGMIRWPLLPAEETLRELVRRRPDMRLQAAMACIEANYERLWDELAPEPRWELWKLAQRQFVTSAQQPVRSYYTDYLERREAEMKAAEAEAWEPETLLEAVRESRRPPYYGSSTIGHDLCENAAIVDKEPTTTFLLPEIGPFGTWDQQQESVYAVGCRAEFAGWELYICSSEEMRQKAREEDGFFVFNEDDYPWSLYPRHYHARDYEERRKREARAQEDEPADVDSVEYCIL
ncbi:hypothetical protein GE09DRAFT_602608 [Coniochaeta sp. 2T2.1]|nr:hypothetical protein GE09DRAFT_602608 [Coniochaeta sp. 2T2.1]